TARLVRASDGVRLWSRRFDRPLADVLRVQDEIAIEVVGALQAALPALERKRMLDHRTDNVAAYDEYLKGLALMPRENVAGLRQALRHFDAAIALDPGFARPHVAAAATLRTIASLGATGEGDDARRAR